MRKQILGSLGFVGLLILTLYSLNAGFIRWTDVSAALAGVYLTGMVSSLVYAFTDWFERHFGVKKGAERSTIDQRGFERAILHSNEITKVTDALFNHYAGVVDRIDQLWDYQPKDEGEQIFRKGTTPGEIFPMWGLGTSSQIPENLKQDKEHFKSFREAWNIYSAGPPVFAEAKRAEAQTRQMVRNYLTNSQNKVMPPPRLIESLTTDIIDKIEARYKIQFAPDFEANMMTVQPFGASAFVTPAIDRQALDELWTPDPEWTLESAKKLADSMNAIARKQDVLDVVRTMREAWRAVTSNRNDFLAAKDKLVQKARSISYHIPELTESECDYCRPLKEKRKALTGLLEVAA